jgi:CDP-paratose 2-epimerase
MLEGMLGISLKFTKLDWRHEDQRFFVADNTKIGANTGWVPQVAREEGVARTLAWIREVGNS